MAQNITLLGASYTAVPAVTLPKTGGGTAQFDDTTDADATAADITTGKTAYVNGVKLTGTGSGGASNVVTGTFKGTTTGAAMDVTLNYSGSGYPIAILVFPSEGSYNSNGTFYSLIKRYAICMLLLVKQDTSAIPSYSNSTNDKFSYGFRYKSSNSNAISYSYSTGIDVGACNDSNANSGFSTNNSLLKFRNNKKMSVFIAGTSYGFAANIEYRYVVQYSS